MNTVKHNLEDSLVKFTEEADAAQAAFEEDVATTEADINHAQLEIQNKTKQLDSTNNQIEEGETFISIRTNDLAGWEADLEAENVSFDEATKAYEDLVAEFQKELEACNDALSFIQNSSINGLIGERISQDVVYGQSRGAGLDSN